MEAVRPGSRVAVIGSGRMGAGIAQVAAAAGHAVSLYDINSEAVSNAIGSVRQNFEKLVAKKRLTAEACAAACSRLTPATSIRELQGVKLVIEAVVEDLETKRQLFRELESVVGRRLHSREQYIFSFDHCDGGGAEAAWARRGNAFLQSCASDGAG